MRVSDLSELAAFDAVARHRSFRRAAEERGVTPSAISHAVTSLEGRVGIRLLNRTTRSVSLTDAGEKLLAQLSPAFGDIGTAMESLNRFRATPYGKVRLNIPASIAPFLVGDVLGPLLNGNPDLQLEIVATDQLVDIAQSGFDAGIRLGESLRDGMIAVKIRPRLRLVVVGSPDYFRKHKAPRTPHDLKDHTGIQNMYPNGTRYGWEFEKSGKKISYHPVGPLALDDHALMVRAALSGIALAYVWEPYAQTHLETGALVSCLDDWCQPEEPFYLYYPGRKYISAGLQAVIDALKV
jgi:DNA-binding transcriptional LysR family regulator